MKYFIYDKKENTLACMCVITDNNGVIKSTKIIKHTFEKLTKSYVEKEWPWINSKGEHIFLYKGDDVPDQFQSFQYLLNDSLKSDLPNLVTTEKSKILQLPEHMIDFSLSFILISAINHFNEHPEDISDFDAFHLFKERNNLENYEIEDFLIDAEEHLKDLLI